MKVPITREGYEALKKEHETMLSVKRPQILKAIEEAREHGDLSENADTMPPGRNSSFFSSVLPRSRSS
jgi:transcription elongation factor GreA